MLGVLDQRYQPSQPFREAGVRRLILWVNTLKLKDMKSLFQRLTGWSTDPFPKYIMQNQNMCYPSILWVTILASFTSHTEFLPHPKCVQRTGVQSEWRPQSASKSFILVLVKEKDKKGALNEIYLLSACGREICKPNFLVWDRKQASGFPSLYYICKISKPSFTYRHMVLWCHQTRSRNMESVPEKKKFFFQGADT